VGGLELFAGLVETMERLQRAGQLQSKLSVRLPCDARVKEFRSGRGVLEQRGTAGRVWRRGGGCFCGRHPSIVTPPVADVGPNGRDVRHKRNAHGRYRTPSM